MQIFALGMDVDVAHPETGQSILGSGDAGEMIVRRPFPSKLLTSTSESTG